LTHDYLVKQRIADGHIAVIGHGRQEEKFTDNEHNEESHLYDTSIIRNGILIQNKIYHHLRINDSRVAKINESQVSDKKIHWCVQIGLQLGQNDHGQVSHCCDYVDDEEDHKKGKL
jgi:hypothetical protein